MGNMGVHIAQNQLQIPIQRMHLDCMTAQEIIKESSALIHTTQILFQTLTDGMEVSTLPIALIILMGLEIRTATIAQPTPMVLVGQLLGKTKSVMIYGAEMSQMWTCPFQKGIA